MFWRIMSLLLVLCMSAAPAWAHFGMVIPETNILTRPGPVEVQFRFWHPRENQGMDLARPLKAGVLLEDKQTDLLPALQAKKVAGHNTWQASYKVERPGDYIFYLEPRPYWEPSEDSFIIHHTKTVVSALGAEEGWDALVGAPLEIKPLTRPYGLNAGNSFSGRVLYKGKPLPDAVVEVEFFDPRGKRPASGDSYITQVIKTGTDGVFTWSLPWPGWWGFAALYTPPDLKLKKDGQDKDVELGGVLWLYAAPGGAER